MLPLPETEAGLRSGTTGSIQQGGMMDTLFELLLWLTAIVGTLATLACLAELCEWAEWWIDS